MGELQFVQLLNLSQQTKGFFTLVPRRHTLALVKRVPFETTSKYLQCDQVGQFS